MQKGSLKFNRAPMCHSCGPRTKTTTCSSLRTSSHLPRHICRTKNPTSFYKLRPSYSSQTKFWTPNQRPYKYHFVQKTEIEKLIKEMLVIQPSHSPFASPVILVKEERWYLEIKWGHCDSYLMNYMGARCFPESRIQLKSGYHQVRVHEADIYKTYKFTFRAQGG